MGDLLLIPDHCFKFQSYLPVFILEGAMGPLTPFWIKWPLVKARLGHLYHYVNGEILDSVLFHLKSNENGPILNFLD